MHERGEWIDDRIKVGDVNAAVEQDGTSETDLYRRALGAAFDEMVQDDVTGKELTAAAWTAFFWQLGNQELAESVWENAGKALAPPALPPNRATRPPRQRRCELSASVRTSSSSPTGPGGPIVSRYEAHCGYTAPSAGNSSSTKERPAPDR